MRFVSMLVVCIASVTGLSSASGADKEPAEVGLKVGEKSPTFTLKDQAGKERSLDEFLKAGKVAIVFYRSAAW